MSVSDAHLVRSAQRGDLDAYAELIARHRAGLQRYATYILGQAEDAEEALQDSLLRAYRAIGSCQQPERFRSWLIQILVNRCRTRLAQRPPQVGERENEAALAGAITTSQEERHDWQEELRRALRLLPEDQREAFLLHHVEEFGYEEMTELTGASVPALKMRVSRACERLRTALREVYRGAP
jgi:RNA polymerase sigma-70 factor, ECF subfamily